MRSLFRKLLAAAAIALSAAGVIQPVMAAQWSHDPSTHPITHKSAEHSCNVEKGHNPPKN